MRARIRRKKRVLLTSFLLIVGFFSFLYKEREQILEEFKAVIVKEISQKLPFSLKIGKFKQGMLKNLVFGDVLIADNKGNFFFLAKNVIFNLSLRDIFLKKYKDLRGINFKAKNISFFVKGKKMPLEIASLEGVFSQGYLQITEAEGRVGEFLNFELNAIFGRFTEDAPKIDLFCRLWKEHPLRFFSFFIPAVIYMSGDSRRIMLEGFNTAEKSTFHLTGEFLPTEGKFSLKIGEDNNFPVRLEGDFQERHKSLKITFDHFAFINNDLISHIFIDNEFSPEEKIWGGRIYSSGTVLNNYLPLPEFEGSYSLRDGILSIDNLNWMNSLSISGEINFADKVSGNLNILLNNFNLIYLAYLYYPDWTAWGDISGSVALEIKKGIFSAKGSFDLTEGLFGPFKFKGGKIKFEGENNILRLTDVRIYKDKGYLELRGEVDVGKLGEPDFAKNIVLIPYEENIEWQGWSISRKDSPDSVLLDKGIDDKLSIQFRSYMQNSQEIKEEKQDEFGIEYKFKEDRSLKLRFKENEEIFGFERRIQF
ncbi:MAG: hypothetical protein AB7E08_02610 [Candidatus Omnitrophota bacterium]